MNRPVSGGVGHKTITRCRACLGRDFRSLLDLGQVPLALDFLAPGEIHRPRERIPLRVVHCAGCFLWQLDVVVAPEALYEQYPYRSSVSQEFVRHCARLAAEACAISSAARPFVVDIASNDGTLLAAFGAYGARILGVDPARNLAPVSEERGVPTISALWSSSLAGDLAEREGLADVITACNVVAHVDDWDDFFAGIARLLSPSGVFIAEMPHLQELVRLTAYDTIFHEHLSYVSLRPLILALARHDLVLSRVSKQAIHCGSLRLTIERAPAERADRSVDRLIAEESAVGLYDPAQLAEFPRRVEQTRSFLRDGLNRVLDAGRVIDGFGASGKGVMLLSSLGFGASHIRRIYDDTPEKQGMLVAGLDIPVVASPELGAEPPDYLLLLAWNFASEIMAKTVGYAAAGGRYILPLPEMRVL